jgi:hypothetical protein
MCYSHICCLPKPLLTHHSWPEVPTQLCRYISDRTGVISFANFPLIWAFGTRNNVLMWVTGWGFGTFNSFHRWVARVSTLEAVVHSIGYTIMVLERMPILSHWFVVYSDFICRRLAFLPGLLCCAVVVSW